MKIVRGEGASTPSPPVSVIRGRPWPWQCERESFLSTFLNKRDTRARQGEFSPEEAAVATFFTEVEAAKEPARSHFAWKQPATFHRSKRSAFFPPRPVKKSTPAGPLRGRGRVGCEREKKKIVVCLCFYSDGTLSFHAKDLQAFSYLTFFTGRRIRRVFPPKLFCP